MKFRTPATDKGRALCVVLRGPKEGFAKTVCLVRLSQGSSPTWIELKYGRDDESLRTVCLARLLSTRATGPLVHSTSVLLKSATRFQLGGPVLPFAPRPGFPLYCASIGPTAPYTAFPMNLQLNPII